MTVVEIRVDPRELQRLFSLIGRNIAGTPTPEPGRSGTPTAQPAAAPGRIDAPERPADAAMADPAPAKRESAPRTSPVFSLAGLRKPASTDAAAARALVALAPEPLDEGAPTAVLPRPETASADGSMARRAETPAMPGTRSADDVHETNEPRGASARQGAGPPQDAAGSQTSRVPARATDLRPRPDADAPTLPRAMNREPVAAENRALGSAPQHPPGTVSDVPSATGDGGATPSGRATLQGDEAFRRVADRLHGGNAGDPARQSADGASPLGRAGAASDGADAGRARNEAAGRSGGAAAPHPDASQPTLAANVAAVPTRIETAATALEEIGLFLGAAGLADAGPQAQPERAGVIASFILNAAMIPGWPPPRPIEPASLAREVALPANMAPLTADEAEAGLLLLRLMRDPARIAALMRVVQMQRRRRRILALTALIAVNVRALLQLLVDELDTLRGAEPVAPRRERLLLR